MAPSPALQREREDCYISVRPHDMAKVLGGDAVFVDDESDDFAPGLVKIACIGPRLGLV